MTQTRARAIGAFRQSVEGGFHCYSWFLRDPWLEPVRTDPAFKKSLDLAEARSREAADAFVAAGGERILGPVQ